MIVPNNYFCHQDFRDGFFEIVFLVGRIVLGLIVTLHSNFQINYQFGLEFNFERERGSIAVDNIHPKNVDRVNSI